MAKRIKKIPSVEEINEKRDGLLALAQKEAERNKKGPVFEFLENIEDEVLKMKKEMSLPLSKISSIIEETYKIKVHTNTISKFIKTKESSMSSNMTTQHGNEGAY